MMQHFWAALPNDIRNMVAQKDLQMITLKQMYNITTMAHRESNAKKISAIKNTRGQPEGQ
jgi:hypothetical protein